MNKFFTLLLFCAVSLSVNAQAQPSVPTTQPFGKIDKADLEMTSCDFEKDANAEILFDKGSIYFTAEYDMVFERHIRIKILNEKGKDEGNIRIEYAGGDQSEYLSNVQAETINSDNGVIAITKVEKKLLYTQTIDKIYKALTFAFPDVRAGSVIEYKYSITTSYLDDFPDWFFQNDIPTRYSEFNTSIPGALYYKSLVMVSMPFVKNTDDIKALANIPSIADEPFMSSHRDNAQRIFYELKSISVPGYMKTYSDSWNKVGEDEAGFDDFGGQIRRKLNGEDDILNKAKSLSSSTDKISYIFNEVKNNIKWNDVNVRYTNDGTSEAWGKKTGNSTEINLVLCHLLQKSGIKALPMLVSTKKHGKVNPAYPSRLQFNKTVAYIPIDSANYYVLDATNKYNIWNETPSGLLNGFGLYVDRDNKKYDLVFLQKTTPVRVVTLVSAEINPDGKMNGTVQKNSFSYYRIDDVESYKTDGEEKYTKALINGDNNLKISALKFENMEVDTLPLTQSFEFNLDLTGSDENYIYFKPNLFASDYNNNDFLSEHRYSDIDFGYQSSSALNGIYKIPAGYKIDAMPKSVSMAMTDNSIVFKRMVVAQDDKVVVRYSLSYRKSLFFKENYTELHEFYKKMNEMLNEQIVLKKS
jgi:hypothetical protein